MSSRLYRAVGLMSGTSMDGIDAALIETDGEAHIRFLDFASRSYDEDFREMLRAAVMKGAAASEKSMDDDLRALSRRLTVLHGEVAGALAGSADVVGFHGHTIGHRPEKGWTWQIGDGALLAQLLRTEVVDDFRSPDVAAGGQGAPLLPAYHRALGSEMERPFGVLNLGGVGNLTWIGEGDEIVAFDTGPANALIDDWLHEQRGLSFDENGALASAGDVHEEVLQSMLDLPWFDQAPPKSLDRQDFGIEPVRGLNAEDGAATLTAFTAETVRLALSHVSSRPQRLLVTGGGRHNPVLMRMITERTGIAAEPVEAAGWRGDSMEAEGFAWFAVRKLRGLPTSFPEISGPRQPVVGGTLHVPS